MPRFGLRKVESIGKNGILTFEELVVDDVRPMKALRDQIRDNPKLMTELGSIYDKMELHAQGFNLPGTSYHDLRDPSRGIPEFEFKSHHLRVFCFRTYGGKIIVSAEFKEPKKADQENQLTRFRKLKNEYLDSLK